MATFFSSLFSWQRAWVWGVGWLLLLGGAWLPAAQAQDSPTLPLHPVFPLLDDEGVNVLDSGRPVSTMQTCGACHDTPFIAGHSFHVDAGLTTLTTPGTTGSGIVWDFSLGYFGRWDPLTYRYLSPAGDSRWDMTTPEWVQQFTRHVGGGPATTSRDGVPLLTLPPDAGQPETAILDPVTGAPSAWDWQSSGVVEMNCFLCHLPDPNNEARVAELQAGRFAWANTATLYGSGIVTPTNGTWQWQPAAFDDTGQLRPEWLRLQDPQTQNCAQCHGLAGEEIRAPLTLGRCAPETWSTYTTGQIVSPQQMVDSGLNLADKETLSRSWDVHAERVVGCTDCHYALNNPIYTQPAGDQPDHLLFDPRRLDLGAYLQRPVHDFAKGQSAQGVLASELDNTLRRCESCHSLDNTHTWLPYPERHTTALACESCHIPELYAPAAQFVDWTVLLPSGDPQSACRGVATNETPLVNTLITGYQPALLARQEADGTTPLTPYNLVTAWYWVYGEPARPVPLRDLEAVWLEGEAYAPAVVQQFDADQDGQVSTTELRLDDPAKVAWVTGRLTARGLDNPRIMGQIQPYTIHHTVTTDEWAVRDCRTCHGSDSRITQPIQLATYLPGGVLPDFVADSQTALTGALQTDTTGALVYTPHTENANLYILGHHRVEWVDWVGALTFIGVWVGVVVHGGLRYWAARRTAFSQAASPPTRSLYLYTVYERLWHWLQTVVILLLIFTGLVIHKPDMFGLFSFSYIVQVHNVLAAILVINGGLSLFYHLVSGEIQQFLPRPYGFFDQAIVQAKYYLSGIFRGAEHPFHKTPQHKLNPLQQITYFSILNLLLPLQVVTGVLMWGAQRWPEAAARLGGLPFLAPFHTLIAWLFAAFIVLHVYLTTTGPTPLAGIRAMIMGWDEVETHAPSAPMPLAPAEKESSTL